ncbi:MAG TPA: DUF5682 family protein, partial [Candidatus Acidoferrales bacterium]|nr:DUF5682 family protein [Candidatus Acidoferrales bacterium]
MERLIRERRPRLVLVEGPADATPLIPLLLDAATAPPVALYAYRPGEVGQVSYYPFCEYSPEYVALRVGQEIGARLAFCDLPAASTLAWNLAHDDDGADQSSTTLDRSPVPGEDADSDPTPADYAQFAAALTDRAGFDSFEEFWEAAFEQEAGPRPPDDYRAIMAEFGGMARTFTTPRREALDSWRERHMAAAARAAVEGGLPAEAVLVVCGAAHASAVAAAFAAGGEAPSSVPSVPIEIALIPFSFPRLSEQSGYGAGNRAPWYYQQIWERQADYPAATRHTLVVLAQRLRQQGYAASLAQCIDAYNLAATLASLRGKLAPGVDEVADAATACLGQGQPAVVAAALRQVLIGEVVGRVTPRVGRTPLQSEFYATAERLALPVLDAPRQVLVHLTAAGEAEQSVFLHRLGVAGIPFAQELEGGLGGRGRAAQGGPLEQLGRVREKWELQWSPATDAQLVERTVWGTSLVEVCDRR